MIKSVAAFFVSVLMIGFVSVGHTANLSDVKAEYEEVAVRAAKATYEVTWGPRAGETFEVKYEIVERQFVVSATSITGTYKVRVMIKETETEWTDRGIDVNVEILDGAALKMKVDCRTCG